MRFWCLVLVLMLASAQLLAQDDPGGKGFQKSNLFVGGNVGLGFGDFTYINFSPHLGYHFNRYIAAGVGINGEYQSVKDYSPTSGTLYSKTKQTMLGLYTFGRVYPIRNLMIQVQPEANYLFGNITFYDVNPAQSYKMNTQLVPSMLIGGGLVLPSPGGEFIGAVFYDILQNVNSPYGKRAIVQIGYNFNF